MKKATITGAIVALLTTVWLLANPPARFGWCSYAYTTYSAVPRPLFDLQVRPDGTVRTVAKTHRLSRDHIEWLLAAKPEVLILATGWDGVTKPDTSLRAIQGCEVHVLRNREALALFNHLKQAGRRVAIHYHSTC